MNLYKLHEKPEELVHHDVAHDSIPKLAWEKYTFYPGELKKREALFTKDAEYAYRYAIEVLNRKRFIAGEAVISKDPRYAYMYAIDVFKGPFKAGEAEIAKDPAWAYMYAVDILKGPFKAGEASIAKHAYYAPRYQRFIKNLSL